MSNARIPNVVIENATLIFRNFSGKQTKFNPAGRRNFNVILDPETAKKLSSDGWNVKVLKPMDEEDDPKYIMQVSVSYDYNPPKIFICGQQKIEIGEKEVGDLDEAVIEKADLIVRPYQWEVNGKCGIKAYLKSLYVTLEQDELESKYDSVYGNSKSDAPGDDIPVDDKLPW